MAMVPRDFQDLATVRIREAESLLAAGLFDGAYYLAGLRETMLTADRQIKLEWGKVSAWRIEMRYQLGVSKADAAEFVRVIAGTQGSLTWLTQYW